MFTFKHPTTILIAGPTQCGKTYFLIQALKRMCIQPEPQRIVWVFSEWQKAYDELARDIPQIEFVKNYQPQLHESFDSRVRNLVILDDQMENQEAHKRSSDSIVKFFTQGSHHRNLTVVYIVQNLFNQDKSMRTVSLNAHYIVVFKNPRDGTQIQTLACQMFPGNPAPLLDAFKDATAARDDASRGYLLLDLHPTSCDALRLLTNVLDEQPTAYVPEQYIKQARQGVRTSVPTTMSDYQEHAPPHFEGTLDHLTQRASTSNVPQRGNRNPKKTTIKRTVKYLSVCENPSAYTSVLRGASDDVIRSICNAALNVEQGDVHLTPAQRQLFSKHRKQIAKLTSPSVDIKSKRSVVASQKGGFPFIPILLELRSVHSVESCLEDKRRRY